MKFHIPFTFSKLDKLKRRKLFFRILIKPKKESKIAKYLKNANVDITREKYLDTAYRSFAIIFVLLEVILTTAFVFFNMKQPFLWSTVISLAFAGFVLFSQLIYPKVYVSRKEKRIERNLIPALDDMLVQLNSGIPLYNILVNISNANYHELSEEFKEAVRKINAGLPQVEVLESLGKKNSSILFRRALWQISNGMKAGSDISIIIRETIKNLTEEQILQIQNYGNKLNPIIMFFMLLTVILPALSITFLTVISSLINLPQVTTVALYIGLFVVVILAQVMFLGAIRSARPSLI